MSSMNSSASAACRLASYLLQQRAFSKDEKLVQILTKKIISMASVEKQAAASEDLCGEAPPSFQVSTASL